MASKIVLAACCFVVASGYHISRDSPIPSGANPQEYIDQLSAVGSGFYPSQLGSSGFNPSSLVSGFTGGSEAAAPSKRESPIPSGANPQEYIDQLSAVGSGFYPSQLGSSGFNPSSLVSGFTGGSEAAAPSKRESPIPSGANPQEYIDQLSAVGSGFYPSQLGSSGFNPSSLVSGFTGGSEAAAPSKRESPIPSGANPQEYIDQLSAVGSGFYPSQLGSSGFNPSSLVSGFTGGSEAAAPSKRESPIPSGANPQEYIDQLSAVGSGFYPSQLGSSGFNPSSLVSGFTGGSEAAAPSKRESPIPSGANPQEYIDQLSAVGSGFYPSQLGSSGFNPSSLVSGFTGGSEAAAPSKRESPIPSGANPQEYIDQLSAVGSGFYPSQLGSSGFNPSSLVSGFTGGSEAPSSSE